MNDLKANEQAKMTFDGDEERARSATAEHARHWQQQLFAAPPRIKPLDRQQHAAAIIAATSKLRSQMAGKEQPPLPLEYCPDLVPTLLRHPPLWDRVSSLSGFVQSTQAAMPVRERQLAIMRTVWLCRAPYQWGEHRERTLQAGFTGEDVERIKLGSRASGWSPGDKAILAAVEELQADSFVSDPTWSELGRHFDERQLLELLILVGQFASVAGLLNSLRLPLEGRNKGFFD
jgi:alkylhydroperoxidase family enzyme